MNRNSQLTSQKIIEIWLQKIKNCGSASFWKCKKKKNKWNKSKIRKVDISDFKPSYICTKILPIFVKLSKIFRYPNFVKIGRFKRFTRDSLHIFGTVSSDVSSRTPIFTNKLHHRMFHWVVNTPLVASSQI